PSQRACERFDLGTQRTLPQVSEPASGFAWAPREHCPKSASLRAVRLGHPREHCPSQRAVRLGPETQRRRRRATARAARPISAPIEATRSAGAPTFRQPLPSSSSTSSPFPGSPPVGAPPMPPVPGAPPDPTVAVVVVVLLVGEGPPPPVPNMS